MTNRNWKQEQQESSTPALRALIGHMKEMNNLQEIPSFTEAIAYAEKILQEREEEAEAIFDELVDIHISGEHKPGIDLKIGRYSWLTGIDRDWVIGDVREAAEAVEDYRWNNPAPEPHALEEQSGDDGVRWVSITEQTNVEITHDTINEAFARADRAEQRGYAAKVWAVDKDGKRVNLL